MAILSVLFSERFWSYAPLRVKGATYCGALLRAVGVLLLVMCSSPIVHADLSITRLPDNPIVSVADDPSLLGDVNGPSVIAVPDWVSEPLGRYYLYFSHHQGDYIRLAYADDPAGPYRLYPKATLTLMESGFPTQPPDPNDLPPAQRFGVEEGKRRSLYSHIASPDVHVVPELHEIRMYYHGLHSDGQQYTRVAVSKNGIDFTSHGELLGPAYFRVFRHEGAWFALAMPGIFYRSDDGLSDFVRGPTLFTMDMRHSAVLLRGDVLHVFYTRVGDAPESILHSTIDLRGDWREWRESASEVVLRPETRWEGADLPIEPSARGAILRRSNQLRDPAVFEQDGKVYLFYAIAGEQGIGVARIEGLESD